MTRIDNSALKTAYDNLSPTYGGLKEDYFALLWLENEFAVPRDVALNQMAFGGNDYGVDGFHFDEEKRNLYIFQFKWSKDYLQFRQSFRRLIDDGLSAVFGGHPTPRDANQVIFQLQSVLHENRSIIDQVFIHFVFTGKPTDADNSQLLQGLQEDLEAKKFLIDQFFDRDDRPAHLIFEYRSTQSGRGPVAPLKAQEFEVRLPSGRIGCEGPGGEQLTNTFLHITDLSAIHTAMGGRFFERNIRSSLSEDHAPNRELKRAFKAIVLDRSQEPSTFPFNHNGVTLFAQRIVDLGEGAVKLIEPRLLNGAQTISTFRRFLESNAENKLLAQNRNVLDNILVPAKLITRAEPQFVVEVTINNNRQNPVAPWNLRANDDIQLALHDRFLDQVGIFYERQEKMFESLSADELEDLDVKSSRPIELLKLTKTFLAADGELDPFSRISTLFESEKSYARVFHAGRLEADFQQVILCYKVQFRLSKLLRAIEECPGGLDFARRARNLVWALTCQAMLNDKYSDWYAENFGNSLVIEADFTAWIVDLATNKVRMVVKDALKESDYNTRVKDERFGFLRSNTFFNQCMRSGKRRYGWSKKRLGAPPR